MLLGGMGIWSGSGHPAHLFAAPGRPASSRLLFCRRRGLLLFGQERLHREPRLKGGVRNEVTGSSGSVTQLI